MKNADNCLVDLEKIQEMCVSEKNAQKGRLQSHDSGIETESPHLQHAKVALKNLKYAFSKGYRRARKKLLKALSGHTVPDVFVYLATDQRRVCFQRFKPEELLIDEFEAPAKWIKMKEDDARNALGKDDFPGLVLLRLGFGLNRDDSEDLLGRSRHQSLWVQGPQDFGQQDTYTARVHVYKGQNLPSADANGLLDPYLNVFCCGQKAKVDKKMCTRSPEYYETKEFVVDLPQDADRFHMAPPVTVQVWDWDRWDSNDYCGSVRIPMHHAQVRTPEEATPLLKTGVKNPNYVPLIDPQWYTVHKVEMGDAEGQMLIGIELIRTAKGVSIPPPVDIHPITVPGFVEIIALGCRNIAPHAMMPIQYPFMTFNTGAAGGKAHQLKKSKNSKTPSGQDPNFMERILVPIDIPVRPIFMPELHCNVVDKRMGGFTKPIVGTCSISLVNKVTESKPFSGTDPVTQLVEDGITIQQGAGFQKPCTQEMFTGNPYFPPKNADKEKRTTFDENRPVDESECESLISGTTAYVGEEMGWLECERTEQCVR